MKHFALPFMFVFALFFIGSLSAYSSIKLYPAPQGLAPSQSYKVIVNGKEAFVYHSPVPAAFCGFEMNEPVDIVIQADRDIKWVDVRPLSAKVKAVFKDSTIRLHIDKPMHLSIELNGSLKMPLFLFADSMETQIPSKTDPNVLFFEKGKMYHPGIIHLKDNQTLYIESGAFVTAVVEADSAKNIRICGHGVLDGTYNYNFDEAAIKAGNFSSIKKDEYTYYHRFINLTDCKNVFIQDVTMFNSTSWDVVPIHCKNVQIRNIKIVSDNPSDDGIDVVRSKHVLIENCFIRTKDDCIAVKANMNYPATEGVDGVLVRRCVFWNAAWGNSLEIGFELNADEVKNIRFTDNDVIHVEAGATFSIHNAGTATVSNIVYHNIRVEDSKRKLFDFAIFRSQYSEDGTRDEGERKKLYLNGAWDGVLIVPQNEKEAHAKYRGSIKNVQIQNIQIVDGGLPFCIFYGYDNTHTVSNITIENLRLYGKKVTGLQAAKCYVENAKGIVFQ